MIAVRCSFCGAEIPNRGTWYREVRGWERVRSQGGANQITHREETGRVACAACGSAIRAGIDPRESRLL